MMTMERFLQRWNAPDIKFTVFVWEEYNLNQRPGYKRHWALKLSDRCDVLSMDSQVWERQTQCPPYCRLQLNLGNKNLVFSRCISFA